jgi:hypothetical protein
LFIVDHDEQRRTFRYVREKRERRCRHLEAIALDLIRRPADRAGQDRFLATRQLMEIDPECRHQLRQAAVRKRGVSLNALNPNCGPALLRRVALRHLGKHSFPDPRLALQYEDRQSAAADSRPEMCELVEHISPTHEHPFNRTVRPQCRHGGTVSSQSFQRVQQRAAGRLHAFCRRPRAPYSDVRFPADENRGS